MSIELEKTKIKIGQPERGIPFTEIDAWEWECPHCLAANCVLTKPEDVVICDECSCCFGHLKEGDPN